MSEYINDKLVKKTRKAHKCFWCPEPIETGSEAVKFDFADGGKAYSEYWHPECNSAANSGPLAGKIEWEYFPSTSRKRGEQFDGSYEYK